MSAIRTLLARIARLFQRIPHQCPTPGCSMGKPCDECLAWWSIK